MTVTRIPSSKLYELMPATKTEKKVGNKTIEVPTFTTLAEELVRYENKYGYNKNGDETMVNIYTNQTEVVGSNNQKQSSAITTNEDTIDGTAAKYTGSLTADEIAKKYAKGDDVSDEEYCFMIKGIGLDKVDVARRERFKGLELT